jgi:hypothetical protein
MTAAVGRSPSHLYLTIVSSCELNFAGIGFETSVLTYFGSLAHNIREIVSGDAKPQGPVVYVLAGVSVFTAVLAATLATISVK